MLNVTLVSTDNLHAAALTAHYMQSHLEAKGFGTVTVEVGKSLGGYATYSVVAVFDGYNECKWQTTSYTEKAAIVDLAVATKAAYRALLERGTLPVLFSDYVVAEEESLVNSSK